MDRIAIRRQLLTSFNPYVGLPWVVYYSSLNSTMYVGQPTALGRVPKLTPGPTVFCLRTKGVLT